MIECDATYLSVSSEKDNEIDSRYCWKCFVFFFPFVFHFSTKRIFFSHVYIPIANSTGVGSERARTIVSIKISLTNMSNVSKHILVIRLFHSLMLKLSIRLCSIQTKCVQSSIEKNYHQWSFASFRNHYFHEPKKLNLQTLNRHSCRCKYMY